MQKKLFSAVQKVLALHFIPAARKIPKTTNLSSAEMPAITAFAGGGDTSIYKLNTSAMTAPAQDTFTVLDACDISPKNCTNDMSGYILPLNRIKKSARFSYAKNVDPIPNYKDVSYNEDVADLLTDDYYYDSTSSCVNIDACTDNETISLYYYTFYPAQINYTDCKLPVIILFHAGGFSDCSGPNYEDSLCYAFSRKGFIVINAEYRQGRIKKNQSNITSAQQMLAIYRACQDARGVVRSVIKRQRNIATNNLPYQVDTNNIFIMGQSAGGLMANMLCYYHSQQMVDSAFPVPPGEMPIDSALGPIDADFYFGEPGIEYYSKIRGLCSMWGALPIPLKRSTDTSYQNVDEYDFLTQYGAYPNLVPMIGFMGNFDFVFPPKKQAQGVYYPKLSDTAYTTEYSCLLNGPFIIYDTSNSTNGTPILRMECTKNIYHLLKSHQVGTLEYIDCKMGHGLANVCGTCPCSTDFGVAGILTKNQVNEYLAARSAFFFQARMNGIENSLAGTQLFYSCEDYRHSPNNQGNCATGANNDSCSNQQECSVDGGGGNNF